MCCAVLCFGVDRAGQAVTVTVPVTVTDKKRYVTERKRQFQYYNTQLQYTISNNCSLWRISVVLLYSSTRLNSCLSLS